MVNESVARAGERRRYGQYCGLAACLDVIGERWTLLIIRELLVGPQRYNELLHNLPGIGTNLLAERLRWLTRQGVVRQHPRLSGRGHTYELTSFGEELREPVLGLARWGLNVPHSFSAEDEVRPQWGVLAVEALIRKDQIPDVDESYEFLVDDQVFHIAVRGRQISVVQQGAEDAVLRVSTDAKTFVDIGSGRLSPFEAVVTKRLSLEGDQEALTRCSRLLGLLPGPRPTAI
ncbi:winged helix-turn-helix transcriptional regulator [Nonomuraea sp. NPDC050478]|uniref:winged helix-turn-helix transcriptional regulator n=1 Tax=unclassified Nonomuraea TaxID=2593643 RepID=UPI0011CDCBA3|nr:winged helix-turn-helix transcriptional regulator [Nonomuraea sp. C10]TXK40183.1 transcriptional regulator [Nonomuraea sp. C10]